MNKTKSKSKTKLMKKKEGGKEERPRSLGEGEESSQPEVIASTSGAGRERKELEREKEKRAIHRLGSSSSSDENGRKARSKTRTSSRASSGRSRTSRKISSSESSEEDGSVEILETPTPTEIQDEESGEDLGSDIRPSGKKETRGRPAKNPENAGMFTKDARQQKSIEEKVEKRLRATDVILNENMEVSPARAAKAQKRIREITEEFHHSPTVAIVADIQKEFIQMQLVVEKQHDVNLKGPLAGKLHEATLKVMAATMVLSGRCEENDGGNEREEWRQEVASLRQENESLRAELKKIRDDLQSLEKKRKRESTEASNGASPEMVGKRKREEETRDRADIEHPLVRRDEEPPHREEIMAEVEMRAVSPVLQGRVEMTRGETFPPAYRPPVQGRVMNLDTYESFAAPGSTRSRHQSGERMEGSSTLEVKLEALLEKLLPRVLGRIGVPLGKANKGQETEVERPPVAQQKRDKVVPQPPQPGRTGGGPRVISVETFPPLGAPRRTRQLRKQQQQQQLQHEGNLPSSGGNVSAEADNRKGEEKTLRQGQVPSYAETAGTTKQSTRAAVTKATATGKGATEGKAKAGRTRVRAPRSAAITITGPKDGPTNQYGELMKEARSKIKPEELGIEELRMRRARTGALVLEIPGKDSGPKADLLAGRLKETFSQRQDIKVARPTKTADMRLRRVEESISVEEIVEAIASQGECQRDEVRTGNIRKSPDGLGTIWVRCPVATANTLSQKGLRVGWSKIRADILDARPIQCYRCMEVGHVATNCSGGTDRSSNCYRCGETGHLSQDCSSALCCPACKEKGKPHSHKIGATRAGCVAGTKTGARANGGEQTTKRKETIPGPGCDLPSTSGVGSKESEGKKAANTTAEDRSTTDDTSMEVEVTEEVAKTISQMSYDSQGVPWSNTQTTSNAGRAGLEETDESAFSHQQ